MSLYDDAKFKLLWSVQSQEWSAHISPDEAEALLNRISTIESLLSPEASAKLSQRLDEGMVDRHSVRSRESAGAIPAVQTAGDRPEPGQVS